MTAKFQVTIDTYQKPPRLLAERMEADLQPGCVLHPVLDAIKKDVRLRFDIRHNQFNVYYSGGSLLRVKGGEPPWTMHFDKKYFSGGTFEAPDPPPQISASKDVRAWVQAFPHLMAAMDDWWSRNPNEERAHCQAMASANSVENRLPLNDYLVLDLDNQWYRRRFDLVAAGCRPTKEDPEGWREPDLVFVEVKSTSAACRSKTSGLGKHACDFRDIIKASDGHHVQDIKREYENVIAQKKRLGLLDKRFPFICFSETVPKLLIVLVGLDPSFRSLRKPLADVEKVSCLLGDDAIRFMRLTPYAMTKDKTFSVQDLPPFGAHGP